MHARVSRLLAASIALAWGLTGAPSQAADDAVASARVEQGGVAVAFDYTPAADGTGLARITLTDAASGRGIEGARPAAWLLARRSEQVAFETSCED